MIVTLTPNPSVDRTVHIDALPRGEVIRARQSRSEPSGKGVNVALALRAHRHPVLAVLPVGGPVGAQLAGMLRAYGVAHRTVPVAGDIRSNVSLVEPDGTVTKVNEPGPVLDGDEVAALIGAALTGADGVTWLAACGSLPPGAPADLYARLVAPARRRGVRVAVDSSGPALAAAVAAGPDLVKPNAHELAEVAGRCGRSGTWWTPRPRCAAVAPAPSWPASAPTAPCCSTTEAPGTARPRSPPWSVRSGRATRCWPVSCRPAAAARRRCAPR
jgi:1-phosphofructokinase